jgi:Kef-type K+ transport system membrane component KefB
MTELTALQDILILLCLALLNAYVFSLLRQSPIVGYLTTGLLVGPYGFHLVTGHHEVELVAEVGIVLLLFTIGLEFSYDRILRLKKLLLSARHASGFNRSNCILYHPPVWRKHGFRHDSRYGHGPVINCNRLEITP